MPAGGIHLRSKLRRTVPSRFDYASTQGFSGHMRYWDGVGTTASVQRKMRGFGGLSRLIPGPIGSPLFMRVCLTYGLLSKAIGVSHTS
jgi:hypothetical protein